MTKNKKHQLTFVYFQNLKGKRSVGTILARQIPQRKCKQTKSDEKNMKVTKYSEIFCTMGFRGQNSLKPFKVWTVLHCN